MSYLFKIELYDNDDHKYADCEIIAKDLEEAASKAKAIFKCDTIYGDRLSVRCSFVTELKQALQPKEE